MDAYDGFEEDELNPIWSRKLLAPNSFEFQSNIVRSGKQALKIIIRPKDNLQLNEGGKASERNELVEQKELRSVEDKEYSYAFSLFIPKEFPIVQTRLVLAQWKQLDELEIAKIDNPILALRYVNGELFITLQTSEERKKIFSTKDEVRGKWLDLKFNIKFSRRDSHVHVWLNDKEIVKYSGITAYNENYGYPKKSLFYFKMGLYRDCIQQQMAIYFDEYKKN